MRTRTAISIHAAREGGDASTFSKTPVAGVFQSTPPVKAATRHGVLLKCCQPISIHAAREGGDTIFGAVINVLAISIHAAREGGDDIARECT